MRERFRAGEAEAKRAENMWMNGAALSLMTTLAPATQQPLAMSPQYKPKGLMRGSQPNSSFTRQDVKCSTPSEQYLTPHSSNTPMPITPHFGPSTVFFSRVPPPSLVPKGPNGMMEAHGVPILHPLSSNPYKGRAFPVEAHVRAKTHVEKMMQNPAEKTLKYRVCHLLWNSASLSRIIHALVY
ncbi:hypothetical protein D9756_002221 [Leucocoprinus leucothites]|uniref:Uncharacterized protein n=1 Tax=Leucocoprinus leucothites TaxID=201217 RepID=A0A8H5GC51_9AGAR|nr:hypothetical protein D9756_002221 [Leucoagaricus leucothites]